VDASIVYVAITRRSIEKSKAMSQLSTTNTNANQHVGLLQHFDQMFAAFTVQNSDDRNAVIERCSDTHIIE
jgi:hypothetical protein